MKSNHTRHTPFLISVKTLIMVKWLSIFLFTFMIGGVAVAQKNSLTIEGTSPDLYLVHTVTPKENFYSIGRMYNVSAKDLAAYNHLQFQNGLAVGQSLKIPLKENNFSQSFSTTNGEALIPVYHTVEPKESLYRVSLHYNKVPLDDIKKWNHLQSNEISIGAPLIVGYLKVAKDESPLATGVVSPVNNVAANEPAQTKSDAHAIPPVVNAERLPPVKKPDDDQQEKKVVETTTPEEPKAKTIAVNTKSNINFSGGYFKRLYDQQTATKAPVSETGSDGVFKSTSGWQDGKYYCFNNDATPGAVIKITDNATNKSVYAKVLDAIPDIKQNSGLSIIISNSAAEELGAEDASFTCNLSYVKQ